MKKFLLLAVVVTALAACRNYDPKAEGISSGTLKIGIDNSYSLMMESQIDVFEKLYTHADVLPQYMPEADVIAALIADSIQSAIINRALTEEELAMFHSRQRFPESVRIAVDGVALVVHPESIDTTLTLDQVRRIFRGEDTTWSQVRADARQGKINVVFDNNRSCNARYIKERFLQERDFPGNSFAVHSNEEVIDYVNKNPGAIGVISVSWISDREDSTSRAFREKVRVVGIIDPTNQRQPNLPRTPHQAYIYDQSYPLRRDVYAIRTGLKGTLGTGFVSHLSGEKGQLIIHKMGMVAATAPVRMIKITE